MKTFGLWAAVWRWHDGDTFLGVLDHGLGWFQGAGLKIEFDSIVIEPIRHRCWGIDCPELKADRRPNPAGIAARVRAETLVPPGLYPAMSYKPDDFGRPLVDLVLPDGRLFSEVMIEDGFATVRKG